MHAHEWDGVDVETSTLQDRTERRVVGVDVFQQLRVGIRNGRTIARVGVSASHGVPLSRRTIERCAPISKLPIIVGYRAGRQRW